MPVSFGGWVDGMGGISSPRNQRGGVKKSAGHPFLLNLSKISARKKLHRMFIYRELNALVKFIKK